MQEVAGSNPAVRSTISCTTPSLKVLFISMFELSDDELRAVASQVSSMSDLFRILRRNHSGGTYRKLLQRILAFGIDPRRKCKNFSKSKISTEDILAGKHPTFQSVKLKKCLVNEGYIRYACQICGTSSWLDKPIVLELDHIDGNRWNHRLENLRLLCPNCHSQTTTFRNKKR